MGDVFDCLMQKEESVFDVWGHRRAEESEAEVHVNAPKLLTQTTLQQCSLSVTLPIKEHTQPK